MTRFRVPLGLIAVLLFCGCTSSTSELPVRSEYSKTASFQEWKTFRFSSDPGTLEATRTRHPKYEQMVRKALEEELTARDYKLIEDGTTNFRVAFELVFHGDKTPQMVPQPTSASPIAQPNTGKSPNGTLIIKMLDPVTGQILWTGQVANIKMNAIDPQKEIKQAVWRVLAEFPPLG